MTTSGYTDVNDFLPEILQYCNGCPSIMVRKHIVDTIINFCERTLVLKKVPSTFCFEEDVHTYTLKFDSDRYVVLAADDIKVGDGDPLIRTTETELDGESLNWRSADSPEPRRFFLTNDINQIRIIPVPNVDIDDDTTMYCVVRPRRNQTEFDEFIFEKWMPAIKAGALSEILLIKAGSWYAPQQAQKWERKYSRLVRQARKTTVSGTGKYPGRVIPQSYEVTGSGTYGRSIY
jgi:hypothetical protein